MLTTFNRLAKKNKAIVGSNCSFKILKASWSSTFASLKDMAKRLDTRLRPDDILLDLRSDIYPDGSVQVVKAKKLKNCRWLLSNLPPKCRKQSVLSSDSSSALRRPPVSSLQMYQSIQKSTQILDLPMLGWKSPQEHPSLAFEAHVWRTRQDGKNPTRNSLRISSSNS